MSWTGTARFDRTHCYRYELTRHWSDDPIMCWIMLNPSQADASTNDPTIRRCMGLADHWGFGGLIAVNLFAYCATDPGELKHAPDPVGRDNDRAIIDGADRAEMIVVGWGRHGALHGRDEQVLAMLGDRDVRAIGHNKDGTPKHPLYARADVAAVPLEVMT